MQISAKNYRQKLKDGGIFFTDPELAKKMRNLLPETVRDVYDPTCGDGALLAVFDDDVPKYGQDVLADQVQYASEHLHNFNGVVGDTLCNPAFLGQKFHAIMANPPYSLIWEPIENDVRFKDAPVIPTRSRADYAFLMHIMYYLAEDGTAVVLNSPGILYRGQREGKLREWFVRQNWIDKVIHVPGGYFEDTKITTALLVLKKHRETTDIEFSDWELDESRTVTFKEIAANCFNLAVSNYIHTAPKKVEEDHATLDMAVRESTVASVRSGLEMSWLLEQFNQGSFEPLLIELEEVVREYRDRYEAK